MLKKISRAKSSIGALLTGKPSAIDAVARTQSIRLAMLDALSCIDKNGLMGSTKAWSDVASAADIQTLWYLRSDILRLLADFHGEQVARGKLDAMTEMFRGIVPANQMPSRRRIER